MIEEKLLKDLRTIFSKYMEIEKVILFGSRANGHAKQHSDIDLCLFGKEITHSIFSKVFVDLEELDTHFSFDLLVFEQLVKEDLKKNIEKGVVIYDREATS